MIWKNSLRLLHSRKSVPSTRINNLIRRSRPSSIDRRNEITRSLNAAHPKSRYIPLLFFFPPPFHFHFSRFFHRVAGSRAIEQRFTELRLTNTARSVVHEPRVQFPRATIELSTQMPSLLRRTTNTCPIGGRNFCQTTIPRLKRGRGRKA